MILRYFHGKCFFKLVDIRVDKKLKVRSEHYIIGKDYLPSTTKVQGLSAMAKLGEPKATENQALLGPDIVMVASPPATLAFSLTFEDNAAKRAESMLKFSWNSLVSLSGQLMPQRIQQTSGEG